MNYIKVIKESLGTPYYEAYEEYLTGQVAKLSVSLRGTKADDVGKIAYLQGQIQGLESLYMLINQPEDIMNETSVKTTNNNKIKYFFNTLFSRDLTT